MNTPSVNLQSRQSDLIKAMRFPLICLVVFAHSAGAFSVPTVNWSLEGWNVFHFFAEMIDRHLCSIGTCWFFVISGYFFLRNLNEDEFNLRWVTLKWKKRIRTLFVPYLIWNTLAVLAIVFKNGLFDLLHLGISTEELEVLRKGLLYYFFTGPADYPLWFLRDLMLMSLFVPIEYLLFKKAPYISLAILIIAFLSPWNPQIPSMRAIFFFSIGAWLGTMKLNILVLCRKVKTPALILAIFFLLVATSQVGRPLHTLLLRIFYPFGMITFMNFCDRMIDNTKQKQRLTRLSASVFFIYAAHEIYILGWTKGLFVRIFGEGLVGTWIRFLFVPIIVLSVCLALYWLLNRLMPRTLAFLCGGRSNLSPSK